MTESIESGLLLILTLETRGSQGVDGHNMLINTVVDVVCISSTHCAHTPFHVRPSLARQYTVVSASTGLTIDKMMRL